MPTSYYRTRVSYLLLAIFGLTAATFTSQADAAICRVTPTGTGTSGASWSAPMNLQSALGNTSCTEIWVAKGTYKPTAGTDRNISFHIRPGVQLYGGFAGNESQRSQAQPKTHVTTLSGDIGVPNDPADNSIRVIDMDGTTSAGTINASTVLDGFTISGGNASDDSTANNGSGGGLRCKGRGTSNECSPTLRRLRFVGNRASWGGAMHLDGSNLGNSSPVLVDVEFFENHARFDGGAIYSDGYGGMSSPTLDNVRFIANSADWVGGAMKLYSWEDGVSNPEISNTSFIGNHANISGGAIVNDARRSGTGNATLRNVLFKENTAVTSGGAIENNSGSGGSASPEITDSSFVDNHAETGGAMYNLGDNASSSPRLNRVTFENNSAKWGGAMYNYGTNAGKSSPILSNVTFSGNTAVNDGGAMRNVGGKSDSNVITGTSSPELSNVTLHGNHALRGGAIYNLAHGAGTVRPWLGNTILWGTASSSGPQVYNNELASSSISFSVVQGGCDAIARASCASSNLSSNPVLKPLANYGGPTRTMVPGPGSSAIGNGYHEVCYKEPVDNVDQRGIPRGSPNCDIGAVEVTPDDLSSVFKNGFEPE